jgi:hypothetical protein
MLCEHAGQGRGKLDLFEIASEAGRATGELPKDTTDTHTIVA